MAKLQTLVAAAICGGLTSLLSSRFFSSAFSVTQASISTIFLYLVFRAAWIFYLYPYHFSPMISIPTAWETRKLFFHAVTGNEALELVDATPNNGFIRLFNIGNEEVITITDPKAIAEWLGPRGDDWQKDPKPSRVLEALLGYGLVTSADSVHKQQRKNLLPAFNAKVIKNLYPLYWTKGCEMLSLIKKEMKEKSTSIVDMDDFISRATLDIIGLAGFGTDFASLTKPNTPLNKSYRDAFMPDASSQTFFLLSILTSPKFVFRLPIKKGHEIHDGIIAVTNFIRERLNQRRADMFKNVDDLEYFEKTGQEDIIAKAMKTGAFDLDGLVEQAKTILGAGHETSATGLTWAIHHLSQPRHREIQTRLRAEIRSLLPSPSSNQPITSTLLESLPYLDAVTKEVLRFTCPVLGVSRVAKRPTQILDVKFPKGQKVVTYMWAINRAKHLWGEDARVFRPERWLEMKNEEMEGLRFFAFGHGHRSCIGRGFAMAESKALIATLIGRYEFKSLQDENTFPRVVWGITAKILGGLDVEVAEIEGW